MPNAPGTFKQDKPRREMTSAERGYDHQWAKLSKLKRQQCPVCEDCRQETSAQVHHITPFDGVSDPLRTRWSNLVALCKACHQKRHA